MQRLRTVKASLDLKNNVPQKPVHLKTNFKKEQQIIEKKNEIQYENRLLLKKMLQIDLKPSRLNKRVLMQEGPSGAFIQTY